MRRLKRGTIFHAKADQIKRAYRERQGAIYLVNPSFQAHANSILADEKFVVLTNTIRLSPSFVGVIVQSFRTELIVACVINEKAFWQTFENVFEEVK